MSDFKDIWSLANSVIRTSRQLINQGLSPLGLSSAEGNIVFHMLNSQGPFRQDDLVAQLDISKPAVSRALDALERKGFVARVKDPADKRANRVTLTESAMAAGPAIEGVYNGVFAQASTAVTPAEAAWFIEVFRRVSTALSVAGTEQEGRG